MKVNRAYIWLCLGFIGCRPGTETKTGQLQASASELVKYASRFTLIQHQDFIKVALFGNRYTSDTTSVFIISKDTAGLKNRFGSAIIIKSPCTKIAALSSIYANMFYALGNIDNLVAIDNIDYINNQQLLTKHKAKQLAELARGPNVDIEQAVKISPDIIFTFGMGKGEKDKDDKLEQTGIPVAISVDHLEESPLARAEWIKFFAAFTGKLSTADSLFEAVELNYLELKKKAKNVSFRPTVFSEIKYSEFWYMPGGNSYMAGILKDAGADYLWRDNTNVGSLPLSFEQVYARAKDADYWIHLSTLRTKKELEASETRYSSFKAFKSGNLYNNTRHTNSKGYSDYWETGMIYPDRILSDLISIFHPELKTKRELYYYEKIK